MSSPFHPRDDTHDDRDRGPGIVGLACGFLGASMVIGLMRLGLRFKKRLMSWDDLCIVVALLFTTIQTLAACIAVSKGYGKPVSTLSSHELSRALFWFYLAQIGYKGAIWPSKISILILYNRVFGDSTHRVTSFGIRLRTSLIILISFGVCFFFISEIVTIFTCVPVQRYWDRSVEGKCQINTLAWWFSQSILNALSDFFILVLPMPLIKELQIPKRQKISLGLIFALGIFVTICTVIRMTTFKVGARGSDTTYDGAITLSWSIIETNVAIICASLPLLRPLISKLVPGFNKSKSRSKDNVPNNDGPATPAYNLKNRFCRSDRSGGHGSGKLSRNSLGAGAGVSRTKSEPRTSDRRDSWDWTKDTTLTTTTATTRSGSGSGSEDSRTGIVNAKDSYGRLGIRGIVRRTSVEVTMEEADAELGRSASCASLGGCCRGGRVAVASGGNGGGGGGGIAGGVRGSAVATAGTVPPGYSFDVERGHSPGSGL